jgi:non-ribosomal peptide synthetase component E (peptide arylation enzyme)
VARPTRFTQQMIDEYTRNGYWEAITLSDIWDRNAENNPQKEAIVDLRTRLTWAEAKLCIDRLALGFSELGFERDDVLVVQLPNSVNLSLLRVSCEKAGILFIPVGANLRHSEMEYILKYVEADGIVIPLVFRDRNYFDMLNDIRNSLPRLKYIFVDSDEVPQGAISLRHMIKQPFEHRFPSDYLRKRKFRSTEVSWINLTTGTTGFPKFVETMTCTRINNGKAYIKLFNSASNDVIAAFSPVAGGPNAGPVYYLAPLIAAKIAMLERFEPELALTFIQEEKITIVCLVPTMLSRILKCPNLEKYDISSVRLWHCGGTTVPFQLGVEVEETLGGKVVQTYGAVDWGGVIVTPGDAPREIRLLTVGNPASTRTEVKLLGETGAEVNAGEAGEIWARGPDCTSGYYKDPEATTHAWTDDGWHPMGDLGKFDNQGNLIILGRKKDIINRGGQKISPIEIENILINCPKIQEVSVIGMPEQIMGEKVCAYIVPKIGQEVTLEEVVSYLKGRNIASYKLPERLEIVDGLPTVAGGQKVDKKALQQDIIEKLKAEVAI